MNKNLDYRSYIEGFKAGCEWGKKCYEKPVKVEVIEHHTFAKPDDVSDIDFPNSKSSEDK